VSSVHEDAGERSLLQVDSLELYYGDAQALAAVSLEIRAGEIVALVGANGAGKSSLIRSIAGIEQPRAGRVRFAGRDITGWDSHRVCELGVAHVAEGRQIFPNLSVLDNLELGAFLKRARAAAPRALQQVLELFPRLAERRRQLAGSLSGGEQQMLAIGRAWMAAPELILLDEPSLGLAPRAVAEVFEAIRELHRRGISLLLVEQNVAASLGLCARGYVLENGRIVLSGSGSDLLRDPRVQAAYLGGLS
jgi:branched-chain amino acid transport system ATP-binding protein